MKLARMLQILRQMVALPGRASRAKQVRMGGFRARFCRFLAIEELEYRRVLDSGSLVVTVGTGTGPGTLYSMIELANLQLGPNRIEFAQEVTTVRPSATLPSINEALVIDGGGRVTIDGAGSPGNGLVIKGSHVSIKNISIGGFASGTGILFQGAGKGKVQGVKIGTNLSGSLATPNNYGIEVDGSSNITIGIDGDGQGDVDEVNVISGNKREAIVVKGDKSIGTLIAGNFIGTDATGDAAIPNGEGVWISSGSSSTLVRGNTISGNIGSGMNISSAKDSVVEGNIIGLNAKGTAKIGNMGNAGVVIYGNAQNTRIGTDGNGIGDVAERNIISGNTQEGIQIEESDNTVVAGNYIGTNFDGSEALPNSSSGIHIWRAPTRARIGTDNSNDPYNVNERNLVSGNSSNGITVTQSAKDTTISGNWIGTDATGANAIPNLYDGLWVGGGSISTRIRGNTISGNTGSGIGIANANGTIVDGNIIGLNANGTAKLANMGNAGVVVYGGAQNTRIGTDGNGVGDSLERNIVSGNAQEGVQIETSDNTVVSGNYIGTNLDGSSPVPNNYSGILIWGAPTNARIGTDGSNDAFNANERNLISGNASNGITIRQSSQNTKVAGNWIGLNASGLGTLSNAGLGVEITENADRTVVGTDGNGIADADERNIISGNSRGIGVGGSGVKQTSIAGNWIGLDSAGTTAFGNNGAGDGIWIVNGARNVRIGTNGDGVSDVLERNTVSGHSYAGIALYNANTNSNIVSGNWIGLNASGTSKLGNGYGIRLDYSNNGVGPSSNLIGTNGDGINDDLEGNVISGNNYHGILVGTGSTNTVIAGNYIGTNAAGNAKVANGGTGVWIDQSRFVTIGGDSNSEKNVISGNTGTGIAAYNESSDLTIEGNYIGLAGDGINALGNGNVGIDVWRSSRSTLKNNVVGSNGRYGLWVDTSHEIKIVGNIVGLSADGLSARTNALRNLYSISSTGLQIGTNGDGVNDQLEGNIFSANGQSNIHFENTLDSYIAGNIIGLSKQLTLLTGVPQGVDGIVVSSSKNIRIGTDGSNDAYNESERNVIAGNTSHGIRVYNDLATTTGSSEDTPSGIVIAGNSIGVDTNGNRRANQGVGVRIESRSKGVRIGTNSDGIFDAREANTIAGNTSYGIEIGTASVTSIPELVTDTVVAGNFIGVLSDGITPQPNDESGVIIRSAPNTLIGSNGDGVRDSVERNIISGNKGSGIEILGGVHQIYSIARGQSLVDGTLPSNRVSGTIAQTDLRDVTGGDSSSWSFNYPIPGGGGDDYAIRTTAEIEVLTAGDFTFATYSDEGSRLKVNGVTLASDESVGGQIQRGSINLAVGIYPIEWLVYERGFNAGFELSVIPGNNVMSSITSANNWKVLGDANPHSQIRLKLGTSIKVDTFYSSGRATTNATVRGNIIGTDANGQLGGLGNVLHGISLDSTKTVLVANNLVSGNANHGIYASADSQTTLQGNFIGTNATGTSTLGNQLNGVAFVNGSSEIVIGGSSPQHGNLLAGNSTGVRLDVPATNVSVLRHNRFYQNTTLAIDVGPAGSTPNDEGDTDGVRNAPVITAVELSNNSLVIEGFARPGTAIDFYKTRSYASGFGQGETYLASVVEGGDKDQDSSLGSYNSSSVGGIAIGRDTTNRFRFVLPLSELQSSITGGERITSVATNPTSEFGNQAVVSRVIYLSGTTITENAGTNATVGTLTTANPDAANTFTYTLVSGTGGTDNAAFNISANTLRASTSFDFETKSSYSVRVRSTDQGGLWTEKVFTISVTDANETPTNISLSASSIAENAGANATIGTLTTTDLDTANTFTYSLVSGLGSTDNDAFLIDGSKLQAKSSFDFENMSSYSIRVRSTDQGGMYTEKIFIINILNINEEPTAIDLSSSTITENSGANTTVGSLITIDDTQSNVIANFDNLPLLPAINSYGNLRDLNSGSSVYSGITWDTRFQIVGREYVEQWVNQGPNTYAKSRSASYVAFNANGDNGLTMQTTKVLTGAWFARVDLGNGPYGATAVTIHALNGSTILGSVSMNLASTTPTFINTGAFLNLSGVTGYRIDRTPQASGIASRLGSWIADDFTFGDSPSAFTYSLVAGTGDADNAAFNINGDKLRASSSFDFETKSSYSVRVRSTDQGGLWTEKVFTISVTDVNETPTNISLSANSIAENAGANATVGTLTTTDPDAVNTFAYTLVSGTGDTDNAAFNISGTALRASSSFDFETKSSYSVRVRSTDQGGLYTENVFTISVTDVNETPTNISLSANSIAENAGANSTVGTLTTTDPDAANTFAYTLVSGTGDTDNAAFNISGTALRASSSFDFETKLSYSVRVRSTDQGGLWTEKVFTISVTDVNETPTNISLSANSIAENAGANATVGTLTTTDPDVANTFAYTLVSGTGDTDNAAFNISANALRASSSFDFETKSSYSVRVRSTDQGGLWTEKVFTISIVNAVELVSVVVNGADNYANAAQRSQLTSIVVTTDLPLASPSTAFSLTNIGLFTDSNSSLASSQILVSSIGNVYTLRFASGTGVVTRLGTGTQGNSLADGTWVLTVSGNQLTGPNQFGNKYADGLYRMFGDSDGDGDVDGTDTLAFRRAQSASTYNGALDWDGNGSVTSGVDSQFFSGNVNKRRRVF